jgi:hypothetical protein
MVGKVGSKSSLRQVGVFKGIIRIVDSVDVPPLFDLSVLLQPKPYLVRVYVMNGFGVQPLDAKTSDPFLKLKLGREVVDDQKNYILETVEPQFYRFVGAARCRCVRGCRVCECGCVRAVAGASSCRRRCPGRRDSTSRCGTTTGCPPTTSSDAPSLIWRTGTCVVQ